MDLLQKQAGIFTWCNKGVNYGQTLQAFAMYCIMRKMGYQAKLIQYRKRIEEEPVNYDLGNPYANSLYEFLWGLYRCGTDFYKEKIKFDFFTKKYIKTSPFCYDKKTIEKNIKDCDVIVCGSDQIWNPASFDPVYFLDIGKKSLKRVSYAPSINDDIDFDKKKHIYKRMSDCLRYIDYISVREDIGVSIIKKISGLDAVHVLDPTLLLSYKDWDKIASKRIIKGSYLVCYVLGEIVQQEETILKIARERGISNIYYINTRNTQNYQSGTNGLEELKGIGPREFVSLIKYADIVFTDSFHATAFSINYGKEFFTFRRYQMATEYGGASRVKSILRCLQLEERFIDSNTETASMEHIDYNRVNKLLNKERKKSYKFLKEALND